MLLDLGDEIPGRLHVARNVLELAAAGDLCGEVEADPVVIQCDPALELGGEQILPGFWRAVREGRRAIGEHVDITVGVDDRIAVEADRLCEIRGVLEVRQVGQVFGHAAQSGLGGVRLVSQLMWIGGTRFWATAAQTFGWISLSSVRS